MTGIGPMQRQHVPPVVTILRTVGWGFTARDVERLLSLPGGGIVAVDGGRVVGCLTVTLHDTVAWIGNVAVAPGVRGRGIATAMVNDGIKRYAQDPSCVRLCSVPKALTLYQRLGFIGEGEIMTMAGTLRGSGASNARPLTPDDLVRVVAWDREAFGADRRALLSRLFLEFPATFWVLAEGDAIRGYLVARPVDEGVDLGPWLAQDAETAGNLLDAAAGALSGKTAEASANGENAHARKLLEARGLSTQFSTTLMRRGEHAIDHARTFGLGGLEKG